MNFDVHTAIVLTAIVFILQSIPLMFLYLLANQYKGINYWLLGNLFLAVGYFMIAWQGITIDFFSIIISNVLPIVGISCLGIGVSQFTQQTYLRYFILALNALWFVIHLHFTYINNNILLKNIIFYFIVSIILIITAYYLFIYKNKKIIISTYFTGIIFLFFSIIFLIRTGVLLSNDTLNPWIDSRLFYISFYLCYFIISFLLTVGFVSMVSQRLYQDLQTLATCDFLTGTLNRRAMQIEINKEIAYCNRTQKRFAVILMDIDRFKLINDNYGHDSGDLVLKHFTMTIKNNIRQEDSLGRWGGEEFLVLSKVNTIEDACTLAERLRNGIENEKVIINHTIIEYTISLGVAVYAIHGTTQEQLVKSADTALYQAKNSGRNRVAIAKITRAL
ncbi:diguanylate cyclase [Gloeothece citriformis PCC 7424]|uniref:Diguanylate cyclase n=1 Tax=Gloeothece citriformis (strain PCC 7424) TaxID=65393 RepID=B7KBD8_GLOC7|nr:GGDEF domain-containing protein [Gloeothece citriformis]ACK71494.1 diguanylate cyclase [Gloeothece citriformis PCC 7424]